MVCEQQNARPRLESLDAIRGFDMLWIVGLGGVCYSIGAGRAGRKAHRKPVEGTPVGGTSFASARHVIYEALAGRRETAYGYVWRHAAKEA